MKTMKSEIQPDRPLEGCLAMIMWNLLPWLLVLGFFALMAPEGRWIVLTIIVVLLATIATEDFYPGRMWTRFFASLAGILALFGLAKMSEWLFGLAGWSGIILLPCLGVACVLPRLFPAWFPIRPWPRRLVCMVLGFAPTAAFLLLSLAGRVGAALLACLGVAAALQRFWPTLAKYAVHPLLTVCAGLLPQTVFLLAFNGSPGYSGFTRWLKSAALAYEQLVGMMQEGLGCLLDSRWSIWAWIGLLALVVWLGYMSAFWGPLVHLSRFRATLQKAALALTAATTFTLFTSLKEGKWPGTVGAQDRHVAEMAGGLLQEPQGGVFDARIKLDFPEASLERELETFQPVAANNLADDAVRIAGAEAIRVWAKQNPPELRRLAESLASVIRNASAKMTSASVGDLLEHEIRLETLSKDILSEAVGRPRFKILKEGVCESQCSFIHILLPEMDAERQVNETLASLVSEQLGTTIRPTGLIAVLAKEIVSALLEKFMATELAKRVMVKQSHGTEITLKLMGLMPSRAGPNLLGLFSDAFLEQAIRKQREKSALYGDGMKSMGGRKPGGK